jgi:hypothetical protein
VVAQVPTAGLKVVTPSRLRKMEAGVVLEIGGKPVAVMFDLVHSRQRFRAASKEGKGTLIGEVAKPAAGPHGNMGLARQITAAASLARAQFTDDPGAALLAAMVRGSQDSAVRPALPTLYDNRPARPPAPHGRRAASHRLTQERTGATTASPPPAGPRAWP